MYEKYTRPSVDDIFAGKVSKYALAIAVARLTRQRIMTSPLLLQ